MIAGGYGNVRAAHVQKREVIVGAKLIVLGGPAMLIGLGGGAASSMATGASSAELDFASVQRANPELERRCQEVVDACWALGRSEEHTSELQSLMRISYAVFCLKKKKTEKSQMNHVYDIIVSKT